MFELSTSIDTVASARAACGAAVPTMTNLKLFSCPPIDLHGRSTQNLRTLAEVIEYNARHNAQHTFCVQARRGGALSTTTTTSAITHEQLLGAVSRCQTWFQETVSQLMLPLQQSSSAAVEKGPPVALFLDSDIGLLIHLFGLLALGVPIVLLSIRLSPAAVAHLLTATGAKAVVVSPRIRTKIEESLSTKEQHNGLQVGIYSQLSNDYLLDGIDLETITNALICAPSHYVSEVDRNVLILHSSGTTGLPKPIYTSHKHLLSFTQCCQFASSEEAQCMNLSTLPLFHVGDDTCMVHTTKV